MFINSLNYVYEQTMSLNVTIFVRQTCMYILTYNASSKIVMSVLVTNKNERRQQ